MFTVERILESFLIFWGVCWGQTRSREGTAWLSKCVSPPGRTVASLSLQTASLFLCPCNHQYGCSLTFMTIRNSLTWRLFYRDIRAGGEHQTFLTSLSLCQARCPSGWIHCARLTHVSQTATGLHTGWSRSLICAPSSKLTFVLFMPIAKGWIIVCMSPSSWWSSACRKKKNIRKFWVATCWGMRRLQAAVDYPNSFPTALVFLFQCCQAEMLFHLYCLSCSHPVLQQPNESRFYSHYFQSIAATPC